MLKNKIAIGLVAAVLLMSGQVFAHQPGSAYGGVQFASFEFSSEDIPEDFNPTGLIGRIGTNLNNNFSIEGRLGLGLSDDTISATDGINTASVSIELDTLIGAYGIGHIMLNETSSVYALIGFTKVDGTISAYASWIGSGSASDDETDLSYGIGADIGVGHSVALNLEYVQYIDKSDFEVSALAAGIKVGF